MRIGYFGDGRWAHRALDGIIDASGLEIAFIVARHDNPDPVLRQYAERLGVPFLTHPNVNDADFIGHIQSYAPDIHVSMSFNQILRRAIIQAAPQGFINCHAGALPFYRGRNVLNWVLINGAEQYGVTVHYIDEGIDTGDIILQRFQEITPADDYGTLLDKAVELCAETLLAALEAIRDDRVEPVDQQDIHPVGWYCSRRREGDEWIDWNWPSERVHNLVRGISPPGPGARTLVEGSPLVILRTALIEEAPAYIDRPGTVVGRNERGVVVKTGDTTLLVERVADLTDASTYHNERVPSFRLGTFLGIDPWLALSQMQRRLDALERRLAE